MNRIGHCGQSELACGERGANRKVGGVCSLSAWRGRWRSRYKAGDDEALQGGSMGQEVELGHRC